MSERLYRCPRCNYENERKNNLERHFKKKFPCENKNNIDLTDELKTASLNKSNPSVEVEANGNRNTTIHGNGNSTGNVNTTVNTTLNENGLFTHSDNNNNTNGNNNANTNTNSNNATTIVYNINNMVSKMPILMKYENLYEYYCKHMPKKQSINEKRKMICGKAIKAFDSLKYDHCLENIPEELNVDKLLMMIRCLLDFPNEYKTNPTDLIYNTIFLHDAKYKQRLVYGSINPIKDKPSWLNDYDLDENSPFIPILSELIPMIRAFERNTLRLMYATCDDNNPKIKKRLYGLYKLILCLQIRTTLSYLDAKSFVNEILDVDEDQIDYSNILEKVVDSKVIETCKMILQKADEDIESEEKSDEITLADLVNELKNEVQRISETMSEAINYTFVNECSYNIEFFNKMKEVEASLKKCSYNVPRNIDIQFKKSKDNL